MKVNRWAKVPFLEVSEKGSTGDADSPVDMSFLEGCRIIKAGYLNQKQLKDLDRTEGGFAIDYLRDNKVCRVVLGFTELGLWIEWRGEIGKFNPRDLLSPEDLLRERIRAAWNGTLGQKIHIEDQPLKRGYSFVGKKSKEVLFLDCSDLKRMGPKVYQHFASTRRDAQAILYDIGLWANNLQ